MAKFPHCAFNFSHNFQRPIFSCLFTIFCIFFRSINSFNDDLALALPPGREFHSNNVPALLMTSSSIRANLSRSTDRNLDNLGLSDEDLLIDSNRTSGKRYFPCTMLQKLSKCEVYVEILQFACHSDFM